MFEAHCPVPSSCTFQAGHGCPMGSGTDRCLPLRVCRGCESPGGCARAEGGRDKVLGVTGLTSSWMGLWLLLCSPSGLGDAGASRGSPSSDGFLFPLIGGAAGREGRTKGERACETRVGEQIERTHPAVLAAVCQRGVCVSSACPWWCVQTTHVCTLVHTLRAHPGPQPPSSPLLGPLHSTPPIPALSSPKELLNLRTSPGLDRAESPKPPLSTWRVLQRLPSLWPQTPSCLHHLLQELSSRDPVSIAGTPGLSLSMCNAQPRLPMPCAALQDMTCEGPWSSPWWPLASRSCPTDLNVSASP